MHDGLISHMTTSAGACTQHEHAWAGSYPFQLHQQMSHTQEQPR